MPPSKYSAVAEVHLAVQHLVLDDLTRVQTLEGVEGLLGQFTLLGEARTHAVEFLLGAALQGAQLGLLGAVGLELDDPGLDLLELVLERLTSRSAISQGLFGQVGLRSSARSSWRRSTSTKVTMWAAK